MESFSFPRLVLLASLFVLIPQEGAFGQGTPLPHQQAEKNSQCKTSRIRPKKGDPVILSTGELETTETDLFIRGRGLDFTFTRTHRQCAESRKGGKHRVRCREGRGQARGFAEELFRTDGGGDSEGHRQS